MKYSNQSLLCNTNIIRCQSKVFCLVAIAMCFYSSFGHSQIGNQSFLIGIETDKTITIQANNANLKDVLLDLEAKTGIEVNFVADTSQRVSVTIENQTIENAIGKLTPNYMIMRDLQDGKETISEIIIISDDPGSTSSGNDSTFLPSGQPAPEIINQEDDPPPETLPTNEPAGNQPGPDVEEPMPTN